MTTLIFIANNAAGYLLIAFFVSYATKPLEMRRACRRSLLATTLASFGWLIFTMFGGWLSDKIGRVKTFQIGYGIVFAVDDPDVRPDRHRDILLFGVAMFVLTIGLGLSYGPHVRALRRDVPGQRALLRRLHRLRLRRHPRRRVRRHHRGSPAAGHRMDRSPSASTSWSSASSPRSASCWPGKRGAARSASAATTRPPPRPRH